MEYDPVHIGLPAYTDGVLRDERQRFPLWRAERRRARAEQAAAAPASALPPEPPQQPYETRRRAAPDDHCEYGHRQVRRLVGGGLSCRTCRAQAARKRRDRLAGR